jgi:hypothetical protein
MVANEFTAQSVRISEENKVAYISNSDINLSQVFPFTFCCRAPLICILFDFNKNILAFMLPETSSTFPNQHAKFKIVVMKFWIADDFVVPAVKWFTAQDQILDSIRVEFQEKYATYMLDNIIQS